MKDDKYFGRVGYTRFDIEGNPVECEFIVLVCFNREKALVLPCEFHEKRSENKFIRKMMCAIKIQDNENIKWGVQLPPEAYKYIQDNVCNYVLA
tara:strand:- start:2947 stop:3228 length:282 start_codon:yes stop_codon:yes gene_type:complete